MRIEKGSGRENPDAAQKLEKRIRQEIKKAGRLQDTGKEDRRIWYILSEQDREIRI